MIDQDRLIKEFTKLVFIDNPSFGERQMGDYLTEKLIGYGFQVSEDNAGELLNGNCGNIYGYLAGNIDLPPILFCAHMDAVEPSRGKRAEIGEDGIIRSEGATVLAADDLAGVAAILEGLTTIQENNISHRPIEVVFTVAEEVYCKGAAVFDCRQVQAKEAYILDLTGPVGGAAYKAPTIVTFNVEIKGKASHAGFAPEAGIHSIKAAAKAISKIEMGAVSADTTVNIGVMQGGLAGNIVPPNCIVKGEIRSFNHEKALEHIENIKNHFRTAAQEIGAELAFTIDCGIVAYEIPIDHQVINRFKQVCDVLHIPVSMEETFGGSDNGIFCKHGIKGIVLANAMNNCHSCEEYSTVDELSKIANITYSLMISRI